MTRDPRRRLQHMTQRKLIRAPTLARLKTHLTRVFRIDVFGGQSPGCGGGEGLEGDNIGGGEDGEEDFGAAGDGEGTAGGEVGGAADYLGFDEGEV